MRDIEGAKQQHDFSVEGAKAGNSKKTPYRAPVSATSTQRMRIKYGLSEGTILGFGRDASYNDMLKRIYLDGTPIMSQEGEQLLDVVVEFRDGSQDQEPISGMPSITVEHDVNVEVKLSAPVSRSFAREETTSFDIRISVPTLYEGNAEGESRNGLIQFKIDVATDGGAFEEAGRFEIYEKILNGFSTTYNVPVTKGNNHVVRVSRLNSEVVSDFSVNKLVVDAIVEVTDVRLRYSNTAILYLEYDAEQFSNVPKLEARIFGKNDLLMPANYDPVTRTYATTGAGTTNGVWDGTWKRDYTDNPVWIALDQLIAKRYALGDKIDLSMINKWKMYGLSQYCDELVSDGDGGLEPRFTCNNMYMQKSEDAYRVLKDIAASLRAKVVWDGEYVTLEADVPRDPVFTFSNANAKDFTYSSTQDSAQRNLINVQYYDKNNKFSSDVVMQRSMSNILSRGKVVDGNYTALGCTSRGQAQRTASYVMNTELYETELVTFTTGLDGGLVRLNDVINVADNSVAGQAVGGRIAAVNGRDITLDRKIPDNVPANLTTKLVINQIDGKTTPIGAIAISADRLTMTLESDPPAGTEAGLVWALLTQDLVPQQFTITDIEFDAEEMQFAISAIQYNPSKYAAIDGGARIVTPPISIVDYDMLSAPISVVASYNARIVQDAVVCDIDVSWSQSTNAVYYQLEMQKEGGEWRIIGKVQALSATLDNMYTGLYTFRVCAFDSLGNASKYTYSAPLLVAGKVLPPPILSYYSVVGVLFGYKHEWIYPAHTEDSRAVRLRFTTQDPVATPVQEWQYIDIAYPTANFTEQDVSTGLRTWFSAAIVDKYGNVGEYTPWQSAVPSADPTQVLDILSGQLTETQLDEELRGKLNEGAEAKAAAAAAQAAATAAGIAATNAQTAANNANAAAAAVEQQVDALQIDLQNQINTLDEGITQETQYRIDGDAANASSLNAYKVSNDAQVASAIQKADTAITASSTNATALTNLTATVNTKNRTYRQTAAPTANLVVGDLWVNTTVGKNNEVRRWNGSAWDDLTDPRTAATATALTTLQTQVTNIDGRTTANSQDITNLNTSLTTLGNKVDTKADATALTNLQATVTQQGTTITSQGTALTKVQSDLSMAGQATSNMAIKSNVVGTYNGVSYPHVAYALSEACVVGEVYTLVWCGEHQRGAGDTNSNLAVYIGGGQQTVDAITNTGKTVRRVTFTKANNQNSPVINFYCINRPTADKNTVATVYWAVLVKGSIALTDVWIPSQYELTPLITANSTAISQLDTKVTGIGDTVTAQGISLTNLQTQVNNKADASALSLLQTQVNTQGNTITSQGTSITTVTARLDNLAVGGDNLVQNGNFAKDWTAWNVWGSAARAFETYAGKRYARLTAPDTTLFKGLQQTSLVPFVPDTDYTVSFLAYTNAASPQYIQMLVHQSGGGNNDPQINMTSAQLTAIPKRYSLTFKSTNQSVKSAFNFHIGGKFATAYDVNISDIQVEQGNVASAWKPCSKEITADIGTNATALTNLQATVTTQGTQINSQATQLTNLQTQVNNKADASALTSLQSTVTTQGTTITSQGTQLTQLTAQLNAVSVGGRNYLLDSATSGTKTIASAAISKILAPSSVISMSFDIDITAMVSAGSRNRIGYETNFSISGFVYYCGVFLTNAASQPIGKYRIKSQFTLPSTWTAGASTFPSSFPYINQVSGGAFTVSNVKLEVGTLHTDWSPAPEDLASAAALTTLDAKVTTIDGTVNSQATQLTTLSTTVNNNTASITSQQTTINGLSAKATLQVVAGNTVGGVSLGNNAGVVDLIVRANTFAIAPPVSANAGNVGKYAFQYRSTSTTLPNGTVVPAGMYVDNASIAFINASQIYADNISAISANLGTFTTSNANGTMLISGPKIEMRYPNGVVGVFIGIE